MPDEAREKLVAVWATWWAPLRARLLESPPTEDSTEERAVMVEFVRGIRVLLEHLGPAVLPLLQTGFDKALGDLLSQEDASALTERRLGLRFLERAVEALSDFFEVIRRVAPETWPIAMVDSVEMSGQELLDCLDPASTALLRLELAVFMAFDLLTGDDTGAFVRWARHAKNAAGRAAPHLSQLSLFHPFKSSAEASPDIVLSSRAFERVLELMENPPTPSQRLREAARRATEKA